MLGGQGAIPARFICLREETMPEFPYTPNPPNVARFLDLIQQSGVPGKVTTAYLESVGFKSKNDRYLIPVLKGIGFLDSSGAPTDNWKAYRDKGNARAVMAGALRSAYSELFQTYPDGYRKDDEALHNYFASRTDLAKATLERVVRTFKVLCQKADFEAAPPGTAPGPTPITGPPATVPASSAPVVNINIQLQLPPTDDESVYEKLFAAMKKHLFS